MSEIEVAKMVVDLSRTTYLDRRIGGVRPDGHWKWQYRCSCGEWCWEDWAVCPLCSMPVKKTNGNIWKKQG